MTRVEKLILGTVQLGLDYGINNASGKPAEAEAFAILDTAWDAGIRMLDTAAAYGDAQAIIGRWHRLNPRKRFSVISKLSAETGKVSARDTAQAMLESLGTDHLWALLHHRPRELLKDRCALDDMCRLRDEGLTQYVGVSIYSNEEMGAFVAVPQSDIIQLPFNMLDNLQQRGAAISAAYASGKTLHVRSVFLQGLFYKDAAAYPAKLQMLRPYVAQLEAIADEYALGIGAMALSYALRHEAVAGVLIGVDSAAQLQMNIDATQRELPAAAVSAIDAIAVRETALLSPVNWQ